MSVRYELGNGHRSLSDVDVVPATLAPASDEATHASTIIGEQASSLEQMLLVLRRRWKMLALCVVLAAAGSTAFSLLQQKGYTASASLLFQNTQFDQELFGSNFTPGVQDPAREQATNLDLVSLPVVVGRTAAALRLGSGLVSSEVSISSVGQANIAQVSVTDPDPVRAARIANTYAQEFVLFRQRADRAKIAGAQALVNQELAALPPSQRYGSVGTTLQNRANQLGALAALQTGNAEVVQPAGVPRSPSTPQTKRNAVLGALLGLLLGMCLVFVSERLDKRIRDPTELESAYGIPVLGVVPESHAYELAGTTPLPSVDTEAFALLRARLRYFNVDREVRSLLITSSTPGEGKTTVALNLAIAEATAGTGKVVLVEGDMRRPALAKRIGLKPVPGLAELLSHNATLDSVIHEVAVPRDTDDEPAAGPSFSVIVAGTIPPNPAELMESRAMADLLSTLAKRFDLAIIDTAPTLAVSDAIPLIRLVSGVLVVTRMNSATRDFARHLSEHLAKLNAPTLGVVANAMSVRAAGEYGYGYGYANTDGHGNGQPKHEPPESSPGREPASGEALSGQASAD